MRQIQPYRLWLGHVGDIRDLRGFLAAGIEAIVDLALNEPPAVVTREMVYCRFPLIDGAGNPPWLLRAAVETVTVLLEAGTPTLLFCAGGMSRSPAVLAVAIARVRGCSPNEGLGVVSSAGPCDVSPGLWQDVRAVRR